jgi:hypothetical protein
MQPLLRLNRPIVPFKPVRSYPSASSGAYADRQSRFEMRAGKRGGDLALFELPATLLWLEGACAPSLFAPAPCDVPPIVDLWP